MVFFFLFFDKKPPNELFSPVFTYFSPSSAPKSVIFVASILSQSPRSNPFTIGKVTAITLSFSSSSIDILLD